MAGDFLFLLKNQFFFKWVVSFVRFRDKSCDGFAFVITLMSRTVVITFVVVTGLAAAVLYHAPKSSLDTQLTMYLTLSTT